MDLISQAEQYITNSSCTYLEDWEFESYEAMTEYLKSCTDEELLELMEDS